MNGMQPPNSRLPCSNSPQVCMPDIEEDPVPGLHEKLCQKAPGDGPFLLACILMQCVWQAPLQLLFHQDRNRALHNTPCQVMRVFGLEDAVQCVLRPDLQYVTDSFNSSSLFHKALKEAFEAFCNKQVGGLASAELMANFCNTLLTKARSLAFLLPTVLHHCSLCSSHVQIQRRPLQPSATSKWAAWPLQSSWPTSATPSSPRQDPSRLPSSHCPAPLQLVF